MTSKITRRDFLNGVAIGAGASLLMPGQLIAQPAGSIAAKKSSGNYYPPTLQRSKRVRVFFVLFSLSEGE